MKKLSSLPFVIDSSVVLSVLNEREELHHVSRKFWDSVNDPSLEHYLIFPRLVWIEVGTRLFQRVRRYDELFEFQNRVLNAPHNTIVELDESIWLTAEMIQYHCHLKTSDLLVVATAYEKGGMLVSWDEKLLKEAGKVVPISRPKDFLLS